MNKIETLEVREHIDQRVKEATAILQGHIDQRFSEFALGFVQGQEPMTVAVVGLQKQIDDIRVAMADMQNAFETFCRMVAEKSEGDSTEDDADSWKRN